MNPLLIAGILLFIGLLLLVAETVIPSHGLIGVLSAGFIIGGIYYCFLAGAWIGVGMLAVVVVASPFVFMWMMAVWPKTPVGRRLVLNATVPQAPGFQRVLLGSEGSTVTELRPTGETDFGELRAEVISEYGIIAAGTAVKVVAFDADGRPVVRQNTSADSLQKTGEA